MTMLLRMLLLIPLFILAFTDEIERPEDVQLAYMTVLKLLACLVLFTLGNVIKTLLAKLLASNFHRKAFFDKMQDALQKVRHPLQNPTLKVLLSLNLRQRTSLLGEHVVSRLSNGPLLAVRHEGRLNQCLLHFGPRKCARA